MARPPTPARALPDGAPTLIADYDSIAAYITWVTEQLHAGELQAVVSREMLAAAGKMTTLVRSQQAAAEMAELRALVDRAEKATDARAAAEVAGRFSQDDSDGQHGRYTDADLEGDDTP